MFANRTEAGRLLAAELARFADADPVVLALPRGGVLVAFEVARALDAPLDVVMVRKIGAPLEPELAVAAVVDGDRVEIVTNEDLVQGLSLPRTWIRDQAPAAIRDIEQRRQLYFADHQRPAVRGKTAILVDDGIATGTTTRAAIRAVRRLQPKQLVLAVPVAPPETLDALRPLVDAVVCLATPRSFGAVGQFYRDFAVIKDEDVRDLLEHAPHPDERAAAL
jgi:putative phosphoribosyl transferase